jgi:pimeloyl-ACP methyl ester carboxylesterase
MHPSLPPALAAWQARGRRLSALGHNVFVLQEGPADGGDPVLVLHGFPSSSFDFHLALPLLAARRRVVLHDHLGFGLSDKPERYSYSLMEQTDAALLVWRALGITRGHLLAHDYGTSIATELLARRALGLLPIELSSVTLCNGSVHIELSHLTPSQQLLRRPMLGPLFARLARPALFKAQLRRILGEPSSVSEEELDWMWAAMVHDGGRERLTATISYIAERFRFGERWNHALTAYEGPSHVLWGRRDPVAVPAIAERLASELPRAELQWLDRLGHYPMLEAPDTWAGAVVAYLDAVERVNSPR